MRYLIYLSLLVLTFQSCTIQKRVHRKGYYVNWHKKEKKESPMNHDEKLQANKSRNQSSNQALELNESASSNPENKSEMNTSNDQTQLPIDYYPELTSHSPDLQDNISVPSDITTVPKPIVTSEKEITERKLYPPSYIGLITCILTALVGIAGIAFFPLLIPAGVLYVVSWVCEILSIRKFKRYPDSYRGKALIWVTLVGLIVYPLLVGFFFLAMTFL